MATAEKDENGNSNLPDAERRTPNAERRNGGMTLVCSRLASPGFAIGVSLIFVGYYTLP